MEEPHDALSANTDLQRAVLLASAVPDCCLYGVPVMLGVDEAGRGPVLGPMVYGAAFWPVAQDAKLSTMGFDDSKALSAGTREQLFAKMRATDQLGYVCVTAFCTGITDACVRGL